MGVTLTVTELLEKEKNDLSNDSCCSLCQTPITNGSVVDENNHFCCHGCHAVYQILSVKGELSRYQQHPIFEQAIKAGLISNPQLLEQIAGCKHDLPEDELKKIYFEIEEMWCPSCGEVIKLMLLRKRGVRNCVVDYTTDLASVEYSPRHLSKEDVFQTIEKLGYRTLPLQGAERKPVSFSMWLRFIIAAFCALNIMMFSYPIYATYFESDENGYSKLLAWLCFFSSLPVVTYCAWPIWRRFVNSARVGILGMETLVLIGVSSAFGLSLFNLFTGSVHVYFDSMSVIIALVLLGKIIESRAKFSAKDSILCLVRSSPKRGRKCFADGSQKFVPLKEITVGDQLAIFTGEKVVLDGIVVKGEGACDESLMTGESLPVLKIPGEAVLGGTFLQNGTLIYRVTAVAEDTALHKIIDLVEKDIGHKTSYVRYADKIVRYFVPIVLFIAFLAGLATFIYNSDLSLEERFTTGLIRLVSVLLISCPCAIGIAAPLAESYMMHALAKIGVLVRNRGCLNLLGKETVFVFDKTGTITEGRFKVVAGLNELGYHERALLKGLAKHSNHPIARATAQAIHETPAELVKIEEIAGKGLKGYCNSMVCLFGSIDFLRQQGVDFQYEGPLTDGEVVTTVYFSINLQEPHIIQLGDRLRSDAAALVKSLKPLNRVLLSGDSENTVKAVAQLCEFDEYRSRYHPLQKREFVETLRGQGEIVCVLGDGINDAPALTAASIGISVVSATDISIQVSDILLTTDRLNVVSQLRILGKRGQRIIKQNLFWAFIYNIIGIGLACMGYLSPLFAASAMVVSSLIVLFNAKRLT